LATSSVGSVLVSGQALLACWGLWVITVAVADLQASQASVAATVPGGLPPAGSSVIRQIETVGLAVRPATLGGRLLTNLIGGQVALLAIREMGVFRPLVLEGVETVVAVVQRGIVVLLLSSYIT
jgi:F0F1-type ATP synthase membrane subunit a